MLERVLPSLCCSYCNKIWINQGTKFLTVYTFDNSELKQIQNIRLIIFYCKEKYINILSNLCGKYKKVKKKSNVNPSIQFSYLRNLFSDRSMILNTLAPKTKLNCHFQ